MQVRWTKDSVTQDTKVNIHVVGMALTIVGVPLGMYLDFFFKSFIPWTHVFMLISFLTLCSWRNLFRLKFISKVSIINLIIIFQIIMLGYAFVSPNQSMQMLSYHFYVLAICIAYKTYSENDINYLPEIVYFLSIPCLIFGVICCYSGLVVGEDAYLYKQEIGSDLYNIDTLTISSGALNSLFGLLCFRKKNYFWKLLFLPTILASGYILLVCSKRTPLFILFISLLLFFYTKRIISLHISVKYLFILLAFILSSFICYNSVDFINNKIDDFVSSFTNGVLGLLGFENVNTFESLDIRMERRQWALNYIYTQFSFFNYIFGGGYFIRWLDFPILQSYLDMGVLGFLLYGFIVVIYPLRIIIKRIDDNNILFALFLAIYQMFGIISTGIPYAPNTYVRICLLAMVYYYWQKRKSIIFSNH